MAQWLSYFYLTRDKLAWRWTLLEHQTSQRFSIWLTIWFAIMCLLVNIYVTFKSACFGKCWVEFLFYYWKQSNIFWQILKIHVWSENISFSYLNIQTDSIQILVPGLLSIFSILGFFLIHKVYWSLFFDQYFKKATSC